MKGLMCRTAMGSDVSRSWKQLIARNIGSCIAKLFRLNHGGFFRTELIQSINPIARVKIQSNSNLPKFNTLKYLNFRCGHGRLLWRVRSFYTEEPETINWLNSIGSDDVLWDIGANVGMYSIYAAKMRGCKVFAFEPESQNYAILVDNIALNKIGRLCIPACLAVSNRSGIGWLGVRYLTKGGAWNQFSGCDHRDDDVNVVDQSVFSVTLDDLQIQYGFSPATHIKIDVDGLEPEIIEGALEILSQDTLRSVLIEVDKDSDKHRQIPDTLSKYGFVCSSEIPTGLSYQRRYISSVNMIFDRTKSDPL